MNRVNNIYEKIYSLDNLRLADRRARKQKEKTYGVRLHDKNKEANLKQLHEELKNKTFKTSKYKIFKRYERKERLIYQLPYFPDRILHHAVMNHLQDVFMNTFTDDTYSCMPKRGVHLMAKNIKKALREDVEGTKYCLKIDVRKFFPSSDHEILKTLLRRIIADQDLLDLLDEIIDSAPGIPIGNYLSQYFANYYLAYFDVWLKEDMGAKYMFRYTDDVVVLSESKEYLHALRKEIEKYLNNELNIVLKGNWQVFPVAIRGIDVVGYRFWHTHTLMRKTIKKDFARAVKKKKYKSIASYKGWAKHCDSKNLLKKLNV